MKNLIFIPAYNGFDKEMESCIESWKWYANKHNIDLVIANETKHYDFASHANGVWERWFDERLFNLEFDKLAFVDSDTMIRWDAPNFFDVFKNKTAVVVKDQGGNVGPYHLNQWTQFNPNIKTPPQNYHNNGFLFLSRENFFKLKNNISSYYEYWSSFHRNGLKGPDAMEQTPTNILFYELFPDEIYYTDFTWNNMVMKKYDDLSFINDSYIWHFTGNKLGGWENRKQLIDQIWNYIKPYYI